jgi:hypothetical protein
MVCTKNKIAKVLNIKKRGEMKKKGKGSERGRGNGGEETAQQRTEIKTGITRYETMGKIL